VDIAPRTFFGYFPSKEDVVFDQFPAFLDSFEARLAAREEGETAIDATRAWIAEMTPQALAVDERELCRRRLIEDSEPLAAHRRRIMDRFRAALTAAVAADLGDEPDDIRPQMVSAAAVAALESLGRLKHGAETPEEALAVLDEAMIFLRGGLAALRRAR
jgi:AcrR family transcriptional regulator